MILSNMKTTLKNSLPKALIVAFAMTSALLGASYSQAQRGDFPAAAGPAPGPQPIDPTTGLPIAAQWKDPQWKDPDKVLAEDSYDGSPLLEVARDLRKKFNDAFDI